MLVANISEIYQTRTLTWSFHVECLKLKLLFFITIPTTMENLLRPGIKSHETHLAQIEKY